MHYDHSSCDQDRRIISDYVGDDSGSKIQTTVWKCSCDNTELCNDSRRSTSDLGIVSLTIGEKETM